MKISIKLAVILGTMLLVCQPVSSQTQESASSEKKVKENTTIGDGYTSSMFFQFHSGVTYGIGQNANFVNLLSPSLDLSVGYHIHPMWSVRFEAGYGQGRGALDGQVYTYQYADFFFDGMFNIINAFKYDPRRICNLYLYAGIAPFVGIQSVKHKALAEALNSNWKPGTLFFAGRVGAALSVNVTKHVSILADFSYIGSSDKLDCKVTNDITSLFNAKIGVQYTLELKKKSKGGQSNGTACAYNADIVPVMPVSVPFYSLADTTDKYKMVVIQKRVETSEKYKIDFEVNKYELDTTYRHNAEEISKIKHCTTILLENRECNLDSVVLVANSSPEGTVQHNAMLSSRRGESISQYLNALNVHYVSRSVPENWDGLDQMIAADKKLSDKDKKQYARCRKVNDLDARENRMKGYSWYRYVKENIYPELRTVDLNFIMSRNDMLKDTICTKVLDTTYMNAVKELKKANYEEALKTLLPYRDYNTALALTALGKNKSALEILKDYKKSPQVDYLLEILYARTGEGKK